MTQGMTIQEIHLGDTAEQANTLILENAAVYADITGDENLIHFDNEVARASRFHQPIAHGMILAGFISGVIGTQLPGSGCLYEKQSINFLAPAFYGDVITTRVTVIGIDRDRNRVVLQTECINQVGKTILTGEAVALPRKDM